MNLGRVENYQSETLSGNYSAPGGCGGFGLGGLGYPLIS